MSSQLEATPFILFLFSCATRLRAHQSALHLNHSHVSDDTHY